MLSALIALLVILLVCSALYFVVERVVAAQYQKIGYVVVALVFLVLVLQQFTTVLGPPEWRVRLH
jgi:hypothetical protein